MAVIKTEGLDEAGMSRVKREAQAMDSSEYSFGYIAGWAGGGDNARAAIAASGNAITMAAKKILDALNQEVAA